MTASLKWSLGVFAFSQAVLSATYAKLPDITAAELIEAVKFGDSLHINVDCKYTVDEQFIKGLYGDWMPEKRKLEIHWRKEGIREYTDTTCYDGSPGKPFRFVLALNGEIRMQWQPNDNKGDIFKKPYKHGWPVPIDFGMTLGKRDKKLGESLADCEITNIRQEKWQGHECYFVEAIRPDGVKADAWIDPEIGWRARRVRLWNPDGLIRRDASGEFKDCGNGAWFPVEGVFKYYGNDKSSGERVVSIERRLKVEQVKVNADLTQKDFEIQFPHGTSVYVHSRKASYIVGVTSLEGFGEEALYRLVGKPLPDMKELGIVTDPNQTKDKMILVCFWDMNQRPSRRCIIQLTKQAKQLKNKKVTVLIVHASKVNKKALNKWVKNYNIPFTVGMVQGDVGKTKFTWGVKSLPWLILTNQQHIIRKEGFSLPELDEKINSITQK